MAILTGLDSPVDRGRANTERGPITGQSTAPNQARTSSCRQCGGNPHAILDAFKAGVQAAVFDTYADNIDWTRRRADLEAERQNHARWSE